MGACGVQLQPLVDALKQEILSHSVLHADETPVAMLAPGKKTTNKAYLWAYCPGVFKDLRAVIYDFADSRAGEHAWAFLQQGSEQWIGKLVCDDYAGYKASFTQGVTEIGCAAHARRKFFELQASTKRAVGRGRSRTIVAHEQRGDRCREIALAASEFAHCLDDLGRVTVPIWGRSRPVKKKRRPRQMAMRVANYHGPMEARMLEKLSMDGWQSLALYGAIALVVVGTIEKLLQRAVRVFDIVIEFARSKNVAWLRRRYRRARAWSAAQQAIRNAKKTALSRIGEHSMQSIFFYLFSGVLTAIWIASACTLTINPHHIPQWKALAWLAVMTLWCAFPAGLYKKAADRERRAAQRLWTTTEVRGTKIYLTVVAVPLVLTTLAWAVAQMQALGGN
jgi:hypothetical protein